MFKSKKKQDSEHIFILIAILLLFLVGSAVFWLSGRYYAYWVSPLKIIGKADLTIDFGSGQSRVFGGDIVENETLINILNQAARAGNFSYKLDENGSPTSIGDLVNGSRKSWHWYLNGEKIDKQFNKIIIKPNDKISIKYE